LRAFRKYVCDADNLRRFNIRTTRGVDGEEVFSFDVGGQRRVEENRVARRLEFRPVPVRGDVREYVENNDVVFIKAERVENPFVNLYN
jgi:hypothetical protein